MPTERIWWRPARHLNYHDKPSDAADTQEAASKGRALLVQQPCAPAGPEWRVFHPLQSCRAKTRELITAHGGASSSGFDWRRVTPTDEGFHCTRLRCEPLAPLERTPQRILPRVPFE